MVFKLFIYPIFSPTDCAYQFLILKMFRFCKYKWDQKRYTFYKKEIKLKSCHNCLYLTAAISWWCSNKKCIVWRGTSIPGGRNCPFYKPSCEFLREDYNKLKTK